MLWLELDRKGDEAVVVLDISLENVGAGTQHSLKPKCQTLQLSQDICSAIVILLGNFAVL